MKWLMSVNEVRPRVFLTFRNILFIAWVFVQYSVYYIVIVGYRVNYIIKVQCNVFLVIVSYRVNYIIEVQ